MNKEDRALLIGSAFSLLELIIRLRMQRPQDFEDIQDSLNALADEAAVLKEKPSDYLQRWKPEG